MQLSNEDNVRVHDRESPYFGRSGWIASIRTVNGMRVYDVWLSRGLVLASFHHNQLKRLPS